MREFEETAKRMLKGLMYHRQLEDYFLFLGLKDLSRQQNDRFMSESAAYSGLCTFYMTVTNKILRHEAPSYESIIPDNWFKHKRQDVDDSTRRDGVRTALNLWVNWEKETIAVYEEYAQSMRANGKERYALYFDKLIEEVSDEEQIAEELLLSMEAVSYDPTFLFSEKYC